MTENITYICDYCGKVFDNCDDCYQHEQEHKFELVKNRVKFIREKNGAFIELPLTYKSVDDCTIIYCDGTEEAWNTIDEAFEQRGYCCPQKTSAPMVISLFMTMRQVNGSVLKRS